VVICALGSRHVVGAPSQNNVNHAEPDEGTGGGCHREVVAEIEGLSYILPPPKPDGHDEESQPCEEPVDKKRGIHGYFGVLPNIPLRGPALNVTSERERTLKRVNEDQNEWSRSEIEFFSTGRSFSSGGPWWIKTVECSSIKMDSCKKMPYQ
jgi:hypothetical protein